ncbi:MAG: 1-(5-phosphoribosyl)-5-[(5-phosphoribosylamino)methylideneamino]imidazole-4-carboxamide isomerase [Spirochaetes bacterium]|nr:1-(5-phosphoribosyl)-5-[(5-phosphoribosylamino)methylideneamino]imidazole-4-carboxamide isomerase [Spirochaetota bacterium]
MDFMPAIDLIEGRCVRLMQGDYRRKTEYDADPVDTARFFEAEGARWVHIIDLDAAKGEGGHNREVLARIRKAVDIPLEVGGGVRKKKDVVALLDIGVSRIILGTIVVKALPLVTQLVVEFGRALAAGIDAKEGVVRISGWTEAAGVDAVDLGMQVKDAGFSRIVYTDIARDGMMMGPNIEGIRRMAHATGLPVIAAGGVSRIEDIIALKALEEDGVEGVISGRAVYEGTLSVRDACRVLCERVKEG